MQMPSTSDVCRKSSSVWELAASVASRLGLAACADVLVRARDTPHQIGLSRGARAANLRDSLWADPRGRHLVDGRRVALIDDVMTTGATARAAAVALRAAGAAQVQVWVLARAARSDQAI